MLRLKVKRQEEQRISKFKDLIHMLNVPGFQYPTYEYQPVGGSSLESNTPIDPRIQAQKNLFQMWHFNQDGLKEYAGERFSITVEKLNHTIETIYSKCFGKKTRPRYEIQEYPNKTVNEAKKDR